MALTIRRLRDQIKPNFCGHSFKRDSRSTHVIMSVENWWKGITTRLFRSRSALTPLDTLLGSQLVDDIVQQRPSAPRSAERFGVRNHPLI